MKHKLLTLILALTVASWAQTATQTAPAQNAAPEKAKCACCDKSASADAKDAGMKCMRHGKDADGKETASCCAGKDKEKMSCCGGKDAKSCMKDMKDKNASCCKDGCGKEKMASGCCGGNCGKGCCGSEKA